MKVEREPYFNPVKVTLETEAELKTFFHILEIANHVVSHYKPPFDDLEISDAEWRRIKQLAVDLDNDISQSGTL